MKNVIKVVLVLLVLATSLTLFACEKPLSKFEGNELVDEIVVRSNRTMNALTSFSSITEMELKTKINGIEIEVIGTETMYLYSIGGEDFKHYDSIEMTTKAAGTETKRCVTVGYADGKSYRYDNTYEDSKNLWSVTALNDYLKAYEESKNSDITFEDVVSNASSRKAEKQDNGSYVITLVGYGDNLSDIFGESYEELAAIAEGYKIVDARTTVTVLEDMRIEGVEIAFVFEAEEKSASSAELPVLTMSVKYADFDSLDSGKIVFDQEAEETDDLSGYTECMSLFNERLDAESGRISVTETQQTNRKDTIYIDYYKNAVGALVYTMNTNINLQPSGVSSYNIKMNYANGNLLTVTNGEESKSTSDDKTERERIKKVMDNYSLANFSVTDVEHTVNADGTEIYTFGLTDGGALGNGFAKQLNYNLSNYTISLTMYVSDGKLLSYNLKTVLALRSAGSRPTYTIITTVEFDAPAQEAE